MALILLRRWLRQAWNRPAIPRGAGGCLITQTNGYCQTNGIWKEKPAQLSSLGALISAGTVDTLPRVTSELELEFAGMLEIQFLEIRNKIFFVWSF